MAQIVHGPAIFDYEERYPFSIVLCKEYPYPENQGEGFYKPKDPVKDLFVARLGFVVGDVSKKLPHGLIFPREREIDGLSAPGLRHVVLKRCMVGCRRKFRAYS
jgi:hypothetical protein